MTSNHNNYIGSKGYTIEKSTLTIHEQQYIRKELSVKPYIPNSMINLSEFPVFRESQNKFYIPKYFGIENFGKVTDYKYFENVKHINVPFVGSVRDYQETIINTYFDKITDTNGGLLEIPCGRGKTVMALNIIAKLKVKTLVIVHKGFLLNQWVERITEFLPTAKVGKIQGQCIDIDDKDIVIGMLQSLSMKDYPSQLFSSFGLTIVDEVHHIAAEVFVRSLFKIITPFTLGLSATMQRKDGLSKVFKMFLGPIIYKEKNSKNTNVLIKAIQYSNADEQFNEIVYDFRGNPQYSTMISKLCKCEERSDFIISVIKDLFTKNNSQQIIVLAHNKNLLTYLFKSIEEQNFATVGYYVGGMKENALKLSESKNIIIATYSMASEALDIKTLTTLVMATPKTDVTQSIGRILRTKHTQPLVVDIIDKHELFRKQWQKRQKYYFKNNYTIQQTTNHLYNSDNWTEIVKTTTNKKKMFDIIRITLCNMYIILYI